MINQFSVPPRFPGYFSLRGAIILLTLSAAVITSCVTTKNSYYFKTLPRDTVINYKAVIPETRIQQKDQLSIIIASSNPEEDKIYNAPLIAGSVTNGTSSVSPASYQVDENGMIRFHKLGMIRVEGLTRRELREKLQTDLQPYLKDPIVSVRFTNHKITVLGEVQHPQVLPLPEEKISLLEALGASGDVTAFARREHLLIIRETDSGRQFKRISLEDQSLFSTDWFYLRNNDVVYVEPNDKKINEEKRSRTQQTISIALASLSTAIIILDRIFR